MRASPDAGIQPHPGVRLRGALVRDVLLAGGTVAIADMTFATVVWVGVFQRATVLQIFQSVATGVLGRQAFQGGWVTAALGLLLHTAVALGWTLVFLAAKARWSRLRRWLCDARTALIVGLVYGALVWLAMDFVVLPLSRARVTPPGSAWFWIQLAGHPVVVGVPIALLVGRAQAGGAAVPSARASSARPSG